MLEVLFIDDEVEIHEIFHEELNDSALKNQVTIKYCLDLLEARKTLAKGFSPDLVISDIFLKEHNLINFLERVNIFYKTPIYLISAYAQRVEKNKILQDHYNIKKVFQKPFGIAQIVNELQNKITLTQAS